jgi:2,5-diamino-6-(ribosylamino)-4(3H)-pyrimidinone 5'-phosphate reductase
MGFPGSPQQRLHVVVHVAVSLDGATTGFEADVGTYYRLAATWDEDVTLTGADTILAQEPALAAAPRPGPAAGSPLLAVVDSRGRVREWAALRDVGHWSGVLAVSAGRTPARPIPVEELVVGEERVDLPTLLDALARRPGVAVVRVDSGGALTGALLHAGLVDEISLLVHPVVVGATGRRWSGPEPLPAVPLTTAACEPLDEGLLWLRSRVAR